MRVRCVTRRRPAPGPCWFGPTSLTPGRSCWRRRAEDAGVALLLGEQWRDGADRCGGIRVEVATGTAIAAARWYRVWCQRRSGDRADPRRAAAARWRSVGCGRGAVTGLVLPSGGAVMFAARECRRTEPIISPARSRIRRSCPASSQLGTIRYARWMRWYRSCLAGWDFSRGHRQPVHHRHRSAGVPRQAGEFADARRGRCAMDRARSTAGATRRTTMARSISMTTTSAIAAGRPISPGRCRMICAAVRMRCISPASAGEDWLPFYVLPRRGGPFAPIVFLASTFTYQAYANHARSSLDAGVLRARRGVGRLSAQSRPVSRSMGVPPTTSIATAAASRSRRGIGRS